MRPGGRGPEDDKGIAIYRDRTASEERPGSGTFARWRQAQAAAMGRARGGIRDIAGLVVALGHLARNPGLTWPYKIA